MKYISDLCLEFTPIPNSNAIDIIYNSSDAVVSNVEIEVPIPNAQILEELYGWSPDKEIIKTIGQRNLTISTIIKAPERRLVARGQEETNELIDLIRSSIGRFNKAKLKAKSSTVKMREYNLFEEYFSYPIDIATFRMKDYKKIPYTHEEITEEYRQQLVAANQDNKKMIRAIIDRN